MISAATLVIPTISAHPSISQQNCRGSCWATTSLRQASFRRDETEGVQRLFDFLEEEECEGVENVAIGFNEGGLRGLFATEDFDVGEYILALPLSATLLIEEISETAVADNDDTRTHTDEIETEVRQALAFLQNFKKDSKWQRYVETLPRTDASFFDGTPDFWSAAALQAFPVPLLRQRSLDRFRSIESKSRQNSIPLDELQWAVWVLRTRGFTTFRNTPGQGLRQRTMLVPLVDMVNHENDSNTLLEAIDTETYEESFVALRALRPIRSGEQITLCYGTGFETSLEILDKYGFFVESNPNDDRIDWKLVETERLVPDLEEEGQDAYAHSQLVQSICRHLYRLHTFGKER